MGTLDSGNVEAVMEGNGWLVEYGDVDALARIVLEAPESRIKRAR